MVVSQRENCSGGKKRDHLQVKGDLVQCNTTDEIIVGIFLSLVSRLVKDANREVS